MSSPRLGTIVDVNGRAVHFHDAGSGRPVVLLHGWSSLGEEMFPAFPAEAFGTRVIALDRPGYGFSAPLDPARAGPDGQADWIAAVLEALDLTDVVLVGHSYGSSPVLCAAADHPERIGAVVLVAPFCRPTPEAAMPLLHAAVAPYIGPLIRSSVVPLIAPYVGPSILASALRPNAVPSYLAGFPFQHAGRPGAVLTMAAELLAFNAAMTAMEERLSAVRVPVGIVYGEADEIAPPGWHVGWLHGRCPDTRIVGLPGIGHAPHHADARSVADLVRSML